MAHDEVHHWRAVVDEVERLLGVQVIAQRTTPGGYTRAITRVATLSDGKSVFVKAAVDSQTREWLLAEHRIYASISGSFMPRLLGWHDEAVTILVLEDLTAAHWPPPWSGDAINAVMRGLHELREVTPPAGLSRPDDMDDLRGGWRAVADDPEPLLRLGLCSRNWLEQALPILLDASERAPLDGDHLVHLDVRSDNVCIRDGGCVFVDWSNAARGNPLLDIALWLPSLQVEGGPMPEELAGEGLAELIAVFAGYLACRAGQPEPPSVPLPGVRPLQLAQLKVCLPWAVQALGLEQPTSRT